MKNKLFWLCLICCSVLACDEIAGDGNSGITQAGLSNQSPPKTASINAMELEKVGQVVSCVSINKKIAEANEADWTKSPFQVALKFAGDQMEARKKVIAAESATPGENRDKLIVTIEEDGLLDDSVGGTLLILRMQKNGATWEVSKASRVWKCWPGRGHVDFSSKPCS